ncbi:MAG TPA: hypothetical protein PLS00_00230 [Niabella sp.]|nr:hypothetical protein [Niabella sp.]
MKRYFFEAVAVILAISAVAFKSSSKVDKKPFATTFYYQPTSYGSTDVATKTNWKSNITPPSCGFTQNKACQFDVADSYTHLEGGGVRVLNTIPAQGSVLNIQTMLGANGSDYVPDPATTGISNINNKP